MTLEQFGPLRYPGSTGTQPDSESGMSLAMLATTIAGTLIGHCT